MKKVYIFAIIIFAIISVFVMVKLQFDKMELLLNKEYSCKTEFKQAQFLGKYDNTKVVRGRPTGGKYDKFRLLDTGEEIKLSYGINGGHSGEPQVLIAVCNYYSEAGKVLKTEYEVSSDDEFFVGRINGGLYDKTFYIYDAKNDFLIETDILENFYEKFGEYEKDLMKVSVYHNKQSKKENGIGKFLLSEDSQHTIEDIVYKKIDSYETEYGTMYILEKNVGLDKYIGILKYGDIENQELIFNVHYSYLESSNILDDFKLIVKEIESEV